MPQMFNLDAHTNAYIINFLGTHLVHVRIYISTSNENIFSTKKKGNENLLPEALDAGYH